MLALRADDERLQGYDAVFFCAGISSVGMSEAQYRPISHDIPVHLASIMSQKEQMTYIFVSGAMTGSSQQMWAKVKRETEHGLQGFGFRQVFNFRPGMMKKTPGQIHVKKMDGLINFLYPMIRLCVEANTLAEVGRAMINATTSGYSTPSIEITDITRLAKIKLTSK